MPRFGAINHGNKVRNLAICAWLLAAPLCAETLVLQSSLSWHDERSEWGGISGIDVQNNGNEFYAVSDKGTIWHGKFTRNEGTLNSIDALDFRPILTSRGEPVEEYNIDAEEIDHDPSGNLYISFESNSRVSRFAQWDAPAELIPRDEAFASFGFNSGPEAMCIGEDEEIWLAPERSGELERPFPIYQFDGAQWSKPIGIPRKPPYLLVGMDYDPGHKKLYILERAVKLAMNFSIRIRSFNHTPSGLQNEAILWEEQSTKFGNLEGISYFERNGERRLMLVSDDNFLWIFPTWFVEFKIES